MVCRRCGENIDTRRRRSDGSLQCPYCGMIYRPRPNQGQQPRPITQNTRPYASRQQPTQRQPVRQSNRRVSSYKKSSIFNRKFLKLPVWIWLILVIIVLLLIVVPSSEKDVVDNTAANIQQPVMESNQQDQGPINAETVSEAKDNFEVVEFGYDMYDEWLYYSVILRSNSDNVIQYPSYRVTARNNAGTILGTEEQTLSMIYPHQEFAVAFMATSLSEPPASVEIEVIEPDEWNVVKPSSLEHPEFIPLQTVNVSKIDTRITGEIYNPNSYAIETAIVSVLFRDENGKLLAGESTYVDSVGAGKSVPFDFEWYSSDTITENYTVYANTWV